MNQKARGTLSFCPLDPSIVPDLMFSVNPRNPFESRRWWGAVRIGCRRMAGREVDESSRDAAETETRMREEGKMSKKKEKKRRRNVEKEKELELGSG